MTIALTVIARSEYDEAISGCLPFTFDGSELLATYQRRGDGFCVRLGIASSSEPLPNTGARPGLSLARFVRREARRMNSDREASIAS